MPKGQIRSNSIPKKLYTQPRDIIKNSPIPLHPNHPKNSHHSTAPQDYCTISLNSSSINIEFNPSRMFYPRNEGLSLIFFYHAQLEPYATQKQLPWLYSHKIVRWHKSNNKNGFIPPLPIFIHNWKAFLTEKLPKGARPHSPQIHLSRPLP